MSVVRIDDKLLKEIKKLIEKEENMYHYPSVSAFVNNAVFEKLNNINKKKVVKNGSS
jgi:uridine kinase